MLADKKVSKNVSKKALCFKIVRVVCVITFALMMILSGIVIWATFVAEETPNILELNWTAEQISSTRLCYSLIEAILALFIASTVISPKLIKKGLETQNKRLRAGGWLLFFFPFFVGIVSTFIVMFR